MRYPKLLTPPHPQDEVETLIIPRNPTLAIGVLLVDIDLYLLSNSSSKNVHDLHVKVSE